MRATVGADDGDCERNDSDNNDGSASSCYDDSCGDGYCSALDGRSYRHCDSSDVHGDSEHEGDDATGSNDYNYENCSAWLMLVKYDCDSDRD